MWRRRSAIGARLQGIEFAVRISSADLCGFITLGYSGIVLLLFANLLLLLIKQGSSIPNKYGASPKAFSFAG